MTPDDVVDCLMECLTILQIALTTSILYDFDHHQDVTSMEKNVSEQKSVGIS